MKVSSYQLDGQGQQLAVDVVDGLLEFLFQGLDLVFWQVLQLVQGLGDGFMCPSPCLGLHYSVPLGNLLLHSLKGPQEFYSFTLKNDGGRRVILLGF